MKEKVLFRFMVHVLCMEADGWWWKLDASDHVAHVHVTFAHQPRPANTSEISGTFRPASLFFLLHCLIFDSVFSFSVDSPHEFQDDFGGLVISLVSFVWRRKVFSMMRRMQALHRLLDDHAARQVLGVVLKEFGCGAGAVGQLQFLQILQLDQAWEACGGQQGAAWCRERHKHAHMRATFCPDLPAHNSAHKRQKHNKAVA